MKTYDLTLVTCRALPEPDLDIEPLVDALQAAGVSVRVAAWDDPSVPWSASPLTILRSPWNYFEDRAGFLAWAKSTAAQSQLLNPVPVLTWNTHKGYLKELQAKGIRTVPTAYVSQGEVTELASICDAQGWDRIVVKPTVSCGSFETYKMDRGALDEARFQALVQDRDMMVQPFVQSVLDYGERSIITIDGQITHSIRKSLRVDGQGEAITGPHDIEDDLRALAEATLASLDETLFYARVDMARDEDGAPMLMELELVEPSLFFAQGPLALKRYVDGVKARLS